jgi:hypothetical protein
MAKAGVYRGRKPSSTAEQVKEICRRGRSYHRSQPQVLAAGFTQAQVTAGDLNGDGKLDPAVPRRSNSRPGEFHNHWRTNRNGRQPGGSRVFVPHDDRARWCIKRTGLLRDAGMVMSQRARELPIKPH